MYGELLALAATGFDVLLTADRRIEYQQNLATLPVTLLIVLPNSNRLEDMCAELLFKIAPHSASPDLTAVKKLRSNNSPGFGKCGRFLVVTSRSMPCKTVVVNVFNAESPINRRLCQELGFIESRLKMRERRHADFPPLPGCGLRQLLHAPSGLALRLAQV